MDNLLTARLDELSDDIRAHLESHCRLQPGEIWTDPAAGHVVGCGDCTDPAFIRRLGSESSPATLAVHDPPYNMVMGKRLEADRFALWCRRWIETTRILLNDNASLYVWMGADQKRHFQPLPQFMTMMADSGFDSRSFITMRNQRGYGTQQNWMAVRQELLYYTLGTPAFEVQYTDIPKILRGYYKTIGDERVENMARSKSDNIRPGNVWVDIQQVFYRMEENVNGCYAQKPLKATERIIESSSCMGDTVLDFFAHSGSTLIACERLGRTCVTCDISPIFAEICIRRLEHFRQTGCTGWKRGHPFERELNANGKASNPITVGATS